MRSVQRASVFVVSAFLLSLGIAWAQSSQGAFPQKPVHLILSFGPAGSTATFSVMMRAKLAALLGQEVVLDYVGGGSGGSNGVWLPRLRRPTATPSSWARSATFRCCQARTWRTALTHACFTRSSSVDLLARIPHGGVRAFR